ncbi:hypothetical protein AX16_005993 [Volvariella volvacea WC 439]|nr:hypothetical protein AX16_005993 [Volvariella volvacea WC 439]
MVNRSARVSGCATGGQIMVSAEVLKVIEACNSSNQADWMPHTHRQPRNVVDAVKRMKITIHPVGDIKLKGLEHPEYLSSIYSKKLVGRLSPVRQTRPSEPSTAISVDDIRQLGILCLRLEALASGRVYRVVNGRKRSAVTDEATKAAISGQDKEKEQEFFIEGDDRTLLPPMENISDQDLVMILDSFCVRIQNTLHHIGLRFGEVEQRKSDMISRDSLFSILKQLDNIDPATIQQIMSAINAAHPPPAIPNS